jgi:ferrous iron transport protein B
VSSTLPVPATSTRRVLLVGRPNVGKSALFGALTGRHAQVSNYPGTTVTVSSGRWDAGLDEPIELLDTPGAYSLLPVTEEERVARDALFAAPAVAVLHVVEAASLDRTLATTVEMIDAGLRVILLLNMWDEAERVGIRIDTDELARRLGCPVIKTVAVRGQGLDALREALRSVVASRAPVDVGSLWVEEFGPVVDELAGQISDVAADGVRPLPAAMPHRIAAVLALRGSRDITERSGIDMGLVVDGRRRVSQRVAGMPPVAAILALRARARELLEGLFLRPQEPSETFQHRFGILLAHPFWGLPFLAAVLYFGFYQLVGVLAADHLVGFLEDTVFGAWVMPGVIQGVETVLPWPWLSSLFVGNYGILNLGITYALALVLPVVGAFFILFSIVEDSGYFPRLALLCDLLFKKVGLNGRAVITMVLGLGCATMATVTTRTLETRRERVIATLLLVLTIPCSAQLGLITALLASRGFALWATYVFCLLLMFAVVGFVAAKVMPGRNATFHMELVPMRWPRPGNVLRKTWNRLYWYFKEVVPLFVYASVLLWLLDMHNGTVFGFVDGDPGQPANALHWFKTGIEPVMDLLSQPREAAESFLIGFFRRDFGAAGLYHLNEAGEFSNNAALKLSDRQMLVGSFTMTLFVPCIASFMMMWKERGSRAAFAIFVAVTTLAVAAGAALNQVLMAVGWR